MFISYIINILKEEPIKSISLNRSKNKCQKTELIVRGLHEYIIHFVRVAHLRKRYSSWFKTGIYQKFARNAKFIYIFK